MERIKLSQDRICHQCNDIFYAIDSVRRRRKFCSKKCFHNSRVGTHISLEQRKIISISNTSREISIETRKKISLANQGNKHPNWKGGISKLPGYWGMLSKRKEKIDIRYRISRRMSNFLWWALKGKKNGRSWESLVGYTANDLIQHLEKQFDDKMSWDNYGSYWHIDHIKPKSLFAYISESDEEFRKCWALTNLQPLEAKANIKKFNHYYGTQ